MKKIVLILSALAATILFISSACYAGNHPGQITVSTMESYYHFSTKRSFDNTSVPNIAFAYNIDSHWGLEADLGLINTNINPPHVPVKQGVHGFLFTLDGIYRFLPHKIVEPFLSFGLGALNLKPNGNDSQYQGNINAGIGAQIFVDEAIAFRTEIRDLYTLSGGKNDYMIDLGLSFLFGSH